MPKDIQELADEKYKLLKANPRHPSLQLKKARRFWSARVGLRHRVVGVDAHGLADGTVWFWIGPHGDYDKLLGYPAHRAVRLEVRCSVRSLVRRPLMHKALEIGE